MGMISIFDYKDLELLNAFREMPKAPKILPRKYKKIEQKFEEIPEVFYHPDNPKVKRLLEIPGVTVKKKYEKGYGTFYVFLWKEEVEREDEYNPENFSEIKEWVSSLKKEQIDVIETLYNRIPERERPWVLDTVLNPENWFYGKYTMAPETILAYKYWAVRKMLAPFLTPRVEDEERTEFDSFAPGALK